MPIQITNNSFIDAFGVSTTEYKSNAGDELTARFEVRGQIRMSSVGNPLTLDPSQNVVTSSQVSWLSEGFRVGDWVRVTRHSSGGGIIGSWYSNIIYVDDILCDFTGMPQWYNITNNEFIVIYALNYINQPLPPASGFYTPRQRDDLDILINHVIGGSGNAGNTPSLIDGENSRAIFSNLSSLNIGSSVLGTFVANQSGQYFKSCEITRNADNSDRYNTYTIDIIFANSGLYNADWFATTNNLKFFMKLLWASIQNDPYPRSIVTYDETANTGFLNQANEVSISNSTLIQGITELDYCIASTHDVVVDGIITDIGIGAGYISTNDLYYRNRTQNQYPISMLVPTNEVATLPLINSPLNEFGAGYDIQINSVTVNVNQTTINFTFTPNGDFNNFMSNIEVGDRLFYIWIKAGNINHEIFGDQLKCDPPVGGILPIENEWAFIDHSNNFDMHVPLEFPLPCEYISLDFDTEDDFGMIHEFFLDKGKIYESLNVKIEAFNTTTNDDFTLQEYNYNFSGVQISGDGKYLLNLTTSINTELPTTSNKVVGFFELRTNDETPTQYLVRLYSPFILNWKYWLQQQNASPDFYPTQDKNWEQYDNLGDWTLRTEISLIENGLAFTHQNTVIDFEYNHDDNISSSIELIRDIDNSIVNTVIDGEIMRIRSTHEKVIGNWNTDLTWGMLTIEPNESIPRSICSTVVPFDNNISNPLTSLTGNVIIISFPVPNIAILECYFDSSKIDLSNGVCITAKIKDNTCTPLPVVCGGMVYENDDCILLENGNDLIIE